MADEVIVVRDGRRYKVLVTAKGQAKIARAALEGRKVNIVQMAVGDGNGGYYLPTPDMTELKREVWRGDITRKEINKDSPNIVDVRTVLDSTVGGFTVREASLIDDEGDTIVLGNMPDIEKVIILEGISSSLTVLLHVAFTNLDAVEIKVNPAFDAASMEDLAEAIEEHNSNPDAHGTAIRDEANRAVEEAFSGGTAKAEVKTIIQDMVAHGEIPTGGGGIVKEFDATLLASGWASLLEPDGDFRYFYDITDTAITDKLMPQVVVLEGSRTAATNCDMSLNSETFDGYIRVKSIQLPTEDIAVVCYLFGSGSGGGSYVLPAATADRLGGVKIGDGINVEEDGTASVDMSDLPDPTVEALSERVVEVGAETEEHAEEMLDEVFGAEPTT